MRKMLILVVASILCGPPATAGGNAGRVDTDFGRGGELSVPVAGYSAASAKLLSDGRIVLLEGKTLRVLLPSGEGDATVGDGGTFPVSPPRDGNCGIAIVIRDALGRFVGVGRCSFPDEAVRQEYPQNYPGKIFAERWTPAGVLDRSFGGGDGMVVSDFGLPPAAPGLLPELRADEASLDALGQIVVAGERAAGFMSIKTERLQPYYEPFVARLTPEGDVDRSFGESGALGVSDLGQNAGMVTDSHGGVLLSYLHDYDTSLLRIGSDGKADGSFGEGGFRKLPPGRGLRQYPFGLLGSDPAGHAVFSAKVAGYKKRHLRNGVALKRLNPDGSLDRTIGRNGVFTARFRRMLYSVEALDEQGRVLVAMAIRPRNPGELRTAEVIGISLARLRPSGEIDRSFGRKGFVKIPFDPKRDIGLERLQVSGEVAVIGKDRCDPGKHCHPVLIRVDLGS